MRQASAPIIINEINPRMITTHVYFMLLAFLRRYSWVEEMATNWE
jgi:hypothetical protein